jgi:hypothetical protein
LTLKHQTPIEIQREWAYNIHSASCCCKEGSCQIESRDYRDFHVPEKSKKKLSRVNKVISQRKKTPTTILSSVAETYHDMTSTAAALFPMAPTAPAPPPKSMIVDCDVVF